jgi:hypothetical protein
VCLTAAAARVACVSAASAAACRAILKSIIHFVIVLIVPISTSTLFCHHASPFCKVKTLRLVTELPSQFACP